MAKRFHAKETYAFNSIVQSKWQHFPISLLGRKNHTVQMANLEIFLTSRFHYF